MLNSLSVMFKFKKSNQRLTIIGIGNLFIIMMRRKTYFWIVVSSE